MRIPSREYIEYQRKKHPEGSRVQLVTLNDPYSKLKPGECGVLRCIDSMGTYHIDWDSGSGLGLVPGEDSFNILPPETTMLKLYLSEFVQDCFASSAELQLQERMRQQFGERTTQFFRSDAHRRRWTHWRELCWRLSDRNKAALFLLTAYESLWRRMIWKCGNDGFDFQAVHLRGIKPELYSVYQAAKAIAAGSSNITLADLASPELVTDEAFQLIICALLMAKYGDVVLNLENEAMKEVN